MIGRLRDAIRRGRLRGAAWVRLLDGARALASSEGRSRLWTRLAHRQALHQVSGYTEEDRYPGLFDLAARTRPDAARILSFGCSTGAELAALRRRFPEAAIVGAEIDARSRALARRRMAGDAATSVVPPERIEGRFDLIFALAVLQVQPHRVAEAGIEDLSEIYPFARFDAQLAELAARLRPGGLLCLYNAHYRVEDSSVATGLEAIAGSPALEHPIFAPDGRRLPPGTVGRSLFRRR